MSEARVTIFVNVFGDVCGVHSQGMLNLSFEKLQGCMETAALQSKALNAKFRETLDQRTPLTKPLDVVMVEEPEEVESEDEEPKHFLDDIPANANPSSDESQQIVDMLKKEKADLYNLDSDEEEV